MDPAIQKHLDKYIRSLAACVGPDRPDGQFVGRIRLLEKFKAILPEVGYIWLPGTNTFIYNPTILYRFTELLETSLKRKSYSTSARNDLSPFAMDTILPEHLPVAKYNEQKWRGVKDGEEVTEKECKAAATRCPAIPSTTPTAQTAASNPVSETKPAPDPARTPTPLPQLAKLVSLEDFLKQMKENSARNPTTTRKPTASRKSTAARKPTTTRKPGAAQKPAADRMPASARNAAAARKPAVARKPAATTPAAGETASPTVVNISPKTRPAADPPEPASPASPPTRSRASIRSSSSAQGNAVTRGPSPEARLLPYTIQHMFLPPLQALLEEACHSYLSTHKPLLLEKKGWTIPQAAELHVYLQSIISTWDGNPTELPVLKALMQLRHAAVHRVPISFAKMEEFFAQADNGATVLGDNGVHFVVRRLSGLFNRTKVEQKDQVIWTDKIEKRLKHLELVKKEIEKEKLQLEAVAPKLKTWLEKPGRDVLAPLQAEVDAMLLPEARERRDEWQEKEEDDSPIGECSRILDAFPRWEIHGGW